MSTRFMFDWIMDRRDTSCVKWDAMDEKYFKSETIHLGTADMDFQSPPAIRKALFDILELGVFGSTKLSEEFYEGVQRWYHKQYGIRVKKEWIVFCPGIEISPALSVQSYTEEGDEVVLLTPSDPAFVNVIQENKRNVIKSPLIQKNGRFVPDLAAMEGWISARTRMMILCSPHTPTGRVWTEEELDQIHAFCKKHDLILYADESYGDLVLNGRVHQTTLGLDADLNSRLILAATPARTFNIPGAAISYMIIPDAQRRAQMKERTAGLQMFYPSLFGLKALEQAYQECDEWYESMKEYLDENEQFTRAFFAESLPGMHILVREGTCHLWINYTELGITEKEMEDWLLEHANVTVCMGSEFGQEGNGYFCLNIGTSRYLLEQAFRRIEQAYPHIFK